MRVCRRTGKRTQKRRSAAPHDRARAEEQRLRHELRQDGIHALVMRRVLLALLPILLSPSAALAQKEIPKAAGHDQCPMGYVNTLGTTCVSPVYYEVAPTNGEACQEGWMNIGAGYCKKKKGPLGIL